MPLLVFVLDARRRLREAAVVDIDSSVGGLAGAGVGYSGGDFCGSGHEVSRSRGGSAGRSSDMAADRFSHLAPSSPKIPTQKLCPLPCTAGW